MSSHVTGIECVPPHRDRIAVETRPSLPIVSFARPELPQRECVRLDEIAARLLREEPSLGQTGAFGEFVTAGLATRGQALTFEDHSAMALYHGRGAALTEYRSLLLAGDGDFVAVGHRPDPAFELYCREFLELGHVERLSPAPGAGAAERLAQRMLRDADVLNPLAEAARRHGVISLVPYFSSGSCWLLGREIAARSGAEVRIAGPPPRLARRVNDKLWFGDRVEEILGRRARPMTMYAYGPAALATKLRTLARQHGRLIVKVPASAASRGNLAIDTEEILSLSFVELRRWLIDMLTGLNWSGQWPLLVGVWDSPAAGSPSVQTWIPEIANGPPIIEGIFDQLVQAPHGNFVGSLPAELPDELITRMVYEAALLAGLLQRLGYFGRCSFDTVLAGSSPVDAKLHWIECNGRWGGVSIPMTLANRLTGDWHRRPFMVVQREVTPMAPLAVEQAIGRLGGRLFRPGGRDEGIVLLSPRILTEGRGLHFMALARTIEAAHLMAQDCEDLLLS
jgi:hypothetical protein